jgi:hypothetical protein
MENEPRLLVQRRTLAAALNCSLSAEKQKTRTLGASILSDS